MAVNLGNTNISKLYLGNTEVTKAYLGSSEVYSSVNNDIVFTVQSDNVGTSSSNQFTIPTNPGETYLYDVSTSDGYTATGLTGNHTITFPSGAGLHTVTISAELGDFKLFYFNSGGDRLKILDISNFGNYGGGGSQQFAFRSCSNLTISATDIGNFETVTNLRLTFQNTSISTLPLIDTSSVTTFETAFSGCNFTTFPSLDLSSGTKFEKTWQSNSNLLNFPANMFDNSPATNYTRAFRSTNLSQTSIDNILVSIDTAGQNNGTFEQTGGSTPSATGLAAIASLVTKGWTVTYTT